jgi:hypothetical protein
MDADLDAVFIVAALVAGVLVALLLGAIVWGLTGD